VRRSFLNERYGPLIDALYDGSSEKNIETEMTFEDGRKGAIRRPREGGDMKDGAVERNAGGSRMNARIQHVELHAEDDGLNPGDVMLKVDNVSLSFGGVKAISDISFDIHKGEIRAIIGPNGAGKTSMLNVINGFYHPQEGVITFRGKARSRMQPYEAAARALRAPSRTWRCSRACRRSTTSCRDAR
jgi:ABC-type multidrug transport system fused ATPase/permease subunit